MTVWSLDRDLAIRELTRLARALAAVRPEVADVVLFGSLATGLAAPGSDADLLIVLRDSADRFPQRIPVYAPFFDAAPLPCEVFPYTLAEIERMKRVPSPVRAALGHGRSLVEGPR